MTRSTGSAQHGVHLGIGQTDRLAVAHHAHRPNVVDDVNGKHAASMRPSAELTQCFQAAIDCRRPATSGNHLLAVSDQVVLGEPARLERPVLQALMPAQKVAEIVPVAPQRRRRQVLPRQTGEKPRQPRRIIRQRQRPRRCLYCTQCHPPR